MWDRGVNPTPSRPKFPRHPCCSRWHTETFCIAVGGSQRPLCESRHRGKESRFLNTSNRENNLRPRFAGPHKNRNLPPNLVPLDRELGFSPGRNGRANPLFGLAPIGERSLSFSVEPLGLMKCILMPLRGGDASIFHRQIRPECFDQAKLFGFRQSLHVKFRNHGSTISRPLPRARSSLRKMPRLGRCG